MSEMQLNATLRESTGKVDNQRLRREGKIPAVLYGPRGNFSLEMDEEATRYSLEKYSGRHELMKLKISGAEDWEGEVLLQDVQKHPYKHQIVHLDFREPPAGSRLKLSIPLRTVGESPGVKRGGVMQLPLRNIQVLCYPDNIPSTIDVDVSELDLGVTLRASDLQMPDRVSLASTENFTVASIVGRAARQIAAAAAAEKQK